jgi:hypothetical protein
MATAMQIIGQFSLSSRGLAKITEFGPDCVGPNSDRVSHRSKLYVYSALFSDVIGANLIGDRR